MAGIPQRRLTHTSGLVLLQVSVGRSLGKRIRHVAPEGSVGKGVRWEELDLGLRGWQEGASPRGGGQPDPPL